MVSLKKNYQVPAEDNCQSPVLDSHQDSTSAPPQSDDKSLAAEIYLKDLKSRLTFIHDKNDQVSLLKKIASLAIKLNLPDDASFHLREILKYDRFHVEALQLLSELRISQKDWEGAWNIYNYLHKTLLPIGKWKPTTNSYNQWIIISKQLFKSKLVKKDWQEAIVLINHLLKIHKSFEKKDKSPFLHDINIDNLQFDIGELYYARGVCDYHLGKKESASYFFNKIPQDSPFYSSKEVYLIEIFQKINKSEQKLEKIKREISLATSQSEKQLLWLEIAELYLNELKQPHECVFYLEKLSFGQHFDNPTLLRCKNLTIQLLSGDISHLSDYFKLMNLFINFAEKQIDSQKGGKYQSYLAMVSFLTSKSYSSDIIAKYLLKALVENPYDKGILKKLKELTGTTAAITNPSNKLSANDVYTLIQQQVSVCLKNIWEVSPKPGIKLILEWCSFTGRVQAEQVLCLIKSVNKYNLPINLLIQLLPKLGPYYHLPKIDELYLYIIRQVPTEYKVFRDLAEIYKIHGKNEKAALSYQALSFFKPLLIEEKICIETHLKRDLTHIVSNSNSSSNFNSSSSSGFESSGLEKVNEMKSLSLKLSETYFAYIYSCLKEEYRPNTKIRSKNTGVKRLNSSYTKKLKKIICKRDDQCQFFLVFDSIHNISGTFYNGITEVFISEAYWSNLSEGKKVFVIANECLKARLNYYFWDTLSDEDIVGIYSALYSAITNQSCEGNFKTEYQQLKKSIPPFQKTIGKNILSQYNYYKNDVVSELRLMDIKKSILLCSDELGFRHCGNIKDAFTCIMMIEPGGILNNKEFQYVHSEAPDRVIRTGHLISSYIKQFNV